MGLLQLRPKGCVFRGEGSVGLPQATELLEPFLAGADAGGGGAAGAARGLRAVPRHCGSGGQPFGWFRLGTGRQEPLTQQARPAPRPASANLSAASHTHMKHACTASSRVGRVCSQAHCAAHTRLQGQSHESHAMWSAHRSPKRRQPIALSAVQRLLVGIRVQGSSGRSGGSGRGGGGGAFPSGALHTQHWRRVAGGWMDCGWVGSFCRSWAPWLPFQSQQAAPQTCAVTPRS